MGARWLQAKRNKIRIRRAHLRQFSSHRIKSSANILHDVENPHTLGERGKAARTYDQPLPPTRPLTLAQSQVVPRAIVLAKLWQCERMQGVDNWSHIDLESSKILATKLFFSGSKFFLVEEDYILRSYKRSIVYNSRRRAIMAHKNKSAIWVESVGMSSPPQSTQADTPAS